MYVMTQIISITDLRKDLFRIADMVAYKGVEVEVEKEGRRIVKLVKIEDDPKERAKRALEILPKLGGIWKDMPEEKFNKMREFFRGKKESEYMKRLGSWSKKKRWKK